MKIDLKLLSPDGGATAFSGEDPASILAWDFGPRDVVRPAGPVHYDLKARLAGTELIVTGRASADFSGTCCRCGGPLRRRYEAEILAERQVAPDNAEADLTLDLRESILLALPSHPVCSDDCPGPAPAATPTGPGKAPTAPSGTNPWSALDGLFGGTTQENQRPRNTKTPKRKK